MKFLTRLRIGPRLGAAFAAVIAIALALGLFIVSQMAAVAGGLSAIGSDQLPKIKLLDTMTAATNEQSRQQRNLLLLSEQAQVEQAVRRISELRQEMTQAIDALEPLLVTAAGKQQLALIKAERAQYIHLVDRFNALRGQGRAADAAAFLMGEVRVQQQKYFAAIEHLKELQLKLVADEIAHGEASYRHSRNITFALLALMAVVAGMMGVVIARSITRPLGEAVRVADAVAAGDLTQHVDAAGRDEVAQLNAALARMVEQLSHIVANVRSGTDEIGTASTQIATGNQDLSSRTEEQASNLQQTAASMEQLTASVQNNANASKQANQLAASASEVAARGGQVVGMVVETMGEIEASSKRIADIINVIDGIAFQTNILALNAAVEAARAGDQGRGFAVVAGEVRNLAQRAAQAAREIKSLINDSVERVAAGGTQVREAGQTMEAIVTQVQRVTDLIGEINSSTIEQSSGITQVNEAVTQLDQVTQQNAALVEQSAAAADSLRQQAQQLAQAVSVFRLARGELGRATVQAAVARAPRRPPIAVTAVLPTAVSGVGQARRPGARATPTPLAPAADRPRVAKAALDVAPVASEWKEF